MTGPARWLQALREDTSLSPHARLAYVMLRAREPDCRPSLATLAANMNVSRSTAIRAVAELTAAGWIKITRRRNGRGGQAASRYRLLIPECQTDTPPVSVRHPPSVCETPEELPREGSKVKRSKDPGGTPPMFPALPVPDLPRGKPAEPTLGQRAKQVTDAYAAAEPFCKWPAVNQITRRALKDGRWSDEQVTAALLALAAAGRAVTVDALRTELAGPPARRSTTDERVGAALRLAEQWAAEGQAAVNGGGPPRAVGR